MKSRLTTKDNRFARILLAVLFCAFYADVFAQTDMERLSLKQRITTAKEDTSKVDNLLALAHSYTWKKNIQKQGLDSAELLINQGLLLSKKLNYLKGIGESIQMQAGLVQVKADKQKALSLYNTALDIFKKSGLVENQAKIYLELAYMVGNDNDNIFRKIDYLQQSLGLYQKIRSKKDIGRVLQELADVNQLQNKLDTSLILLKQSLDAYQEAGSTDLQGIYSLYSNVYFQKSDLTSSLKYGLLAAKTAEELEDSSEHLIAIYQHIGNVYNYSGDLQQASNWFGKARNMAIFLKNTESVAMINTSISEGLIMSDKLGEAIALLRNTERQFPPKVFMTKVRLNLFLIRSYVYAGEATKAVKNFNQIVAWYDSLPKTSYARNEIVIEIIEYLHATAQYKKAYPYMNEYREVAQRTNDLMQLINVEGMYFTADSSTGNFRGAFEHYKRYRSYSDSMNGIETIRQIKDLEVKYETEKKTKEIQLLTYNNRLKDVSLEKENTTKKAIIGIAILLFLLLVVLYSRYLLKQRSTKRLQLKQEQINQQNEQLKKLLHDKEWLLKEIHHRVKNNLQIVISLLNTQSAYLNNEAALEAIQNSQHRMHAMSLIHQRLYQSDDMTIIDMKWYIRELIGYIKDCVNENERLVFGTDLDDVSLDIVQAIPLGLILNESITNAIKYAFPNGRQGKINVSLKWIDHHTCQLLVADNGIGLPPDFDIQQSASLGMSLMYGLTEQLGGTLKLTTDEGTRLMISFEVNTQLKIEKAA